MADPAMKTTAAIAALNAWGMKVSLNHVYLINSKSIQSKRPPKREAAVASAQRIGFDIAR
ncbi:MAG: hypothetical protein ACJ8C4_15425 [Gemmataceae bacterium]